MEHDDFSKQRDSFDTHPNNDSRIAQHNTLFEVVQSVRISLAQTLRRRFNHGGAVDFVDCRVMVGWNTTRPDPTLSLCITYFRKCVRSSFPRKSGVVTRHRSSYSLNQEKSSSEVILFRRPLVEKISGHMQLKSGEQTVRYGSSELHVFDLHLSYPGSSKSDYFSGRDVDVGTLFCDILLRVWFERLGL